MVMIEEVHKGTKAVRLSYYQALFNGIVQNCILIRFVTRRDGRMSRARPSPVMGDRGTRISAIRTLVESNQ